VTSGVCSGTSSTASIVTITGATIPSSRSVIFNSTGTFGFEASYPGDGNNNAATGPCEPVTVNKATPSLTTAISPSSTVTQGTAVTDHGTITGGFPSTGVTGSVSYFFFTGGACAGTATSEGTVTIGAGNSVPASNCVRWAVQF
jgi:hypothetical protein